MEYYSIIKRNTVSCIEPGLAIRFIYDIIHVSMPFSQIIHPLPLPLPQSFKFTVICFFSCMLYLVRPNILLIFPFWVNMT